MATEPSQPIKLFYCYSHKDRLLRDQLDSHLSTLRRAGLIATWYDGEILPGTSWEQEIKYQLNTAHIILLLVSADFIESDYCYGKEMERAIARHNAKEACVIPILLRPVNWTDTPFGGLQALPSNAQPITRWSNRDEAFKDVAEGVSRVVREFPWPGSMIQQVEQERKILHPQQRSQEKYNIQIGKGTGIIIGDDLVTRRQLLLRGGGIGAGIIVVGVAGRLSIAWLLSSHPSTSPSSTPAPTSTPYTGKPTNSSGPFYVYNHYDPRGFMGDIGDITKEEQPNDRLVRFIYDAQGRGSHEWDLKYIGGQLNPSPAKFAGIMFIDGNWGKDSEAGFDLRGRPVIKWEARSLNGPVWVLFGTGGVTWVWDDAVKKRVDLLHPDSMPSIKLGESQLTAQWQAFNPRLSLPDDDLRRVIGAFWWIIKWDSNGVQVGQPKTFTIEVRNISYERA